MSGADLHNRCSSQLALEGAALLRSRRRTERGDSDVGADHALRARSAVISLRATHDHSEGKFVPEIARPLSPRSLLS